MCWVRWCGSLSTLTQNNTRLYFIYDKLMLYWLGKLSLRLTNVCVIHDTIQAGSIYYLSLSFTTIQSSSGLRFHGVWGKRRTECWRHALKNYVSRSRNSQFVIILVKYYAVLCESAQWTLSSHSTHVTNSNMAANSAQQNYKKMKITINVSLLRTVVMCLN